MSRLLRIATAGGGRANDGSGVGLALLGRKLFPRFGG